ncbi:hypothetical protein ACFSKU_17760 [Pontibacter silvestris]|uniref:Uncharacterized protein n=1 Tax=Pontibacter silvestris TaxID=2305183 RepID=A0ABW4X2A8_9BACT|nr:hypothetical protein [Pontibacter silvestris]MCC9135872.1 hypothetical protein [Pontibacter silvestris]
MKPQYLLLLIPLLIVDILTFTEVASLVRQPSDMAVATGLFLLVVLIAANFFVIRYAISKLNA